MLKNDYHVGLDIGSSSVGWAAINEEYRPVKLKGKTAIGVRLFKEGSTAAERRSFRTTRRRLSRRKWRLSLLEEFFDPYMTEVDPTFFARLKQSNLSPRDSNKQFTGSLLFPDRTDAAYAKDYPTIYHLRNKLMHEKKKFDLREIFLAVHHIIKYRGNFLNSTPVSRFSTDKIDFKDIFTKLNSLYQDIDPQKLFAINLTHLEEIEELLLNPQIRKIDKKSQLIKLMIVDTPDKDLKKLNKKITTEISKAILGYKTNLDEILKIDTKDRNRWKITFADPNLDETLNGLATELSESQQAILDILVQLYSQLTLNENVPSGMSLSEAMIEKYDTHHQHLKLLKEYVKTIDRKKRKQVAEAYAKYVGNSAHKTEKPYKQEDFYKEVKKNLDKSAIGQKIQQLIADQAFMPKQRTNENGVISYQLNQKELDQIIENQSVYYPWLAELNPIKEHSDAKYKLDELIAFRVPYYVGPLIDPTKGPETKQFKQDASFAWMVRKEAGQITPWNFEKKVDKVKSANNFIRHMTTKDTYLIGEDVLPSHSLLYERFKVLDELNKIRVNGHKLEVAVKQNIYNDLFKQQKTITKKKLADYLQCTQQLLERPQITGLADPVKFNNTLGSYLDLVKIFGKETVENPLRRDDFEKIIEWSTIFEDSKILRKKLMEIDWLTTNQIDQLVGHRYQGWGRLSHKLLAELTDQDGHSIIDLMWNTQRTFMELQSRAVFAEQIKNTNQDQLKSNDYEAMLAEAYTSPQNKKAIRQVVRVVDDIVRAAGKAPKFISLEFARSDERSKRTHSRLSKIQQVYETTAKELIQNDSLRQELAGVTDLSDRLYLYFTQLGKDIYTGKSINIDEISTHYDIDHILPQAFLKDDSLDNRVLISRKVNNAKSNTVPALQFSKMKPFWYQLQKHGLISKRKLANLLTNPDSIDKFKANGFVNRQLVETRQVIKLAANILASRYPKTKIIEVKASLTHQMREDFNLIKNRDVNDYHHAFDGYLSAFVGQYLYNRYPRLQPYFVYGKFKKFDKQSTRIGMKLNHFNFLYDLSNDKVDKIINRETGEIIAERKQLKNELQRVYNFKYMLVSQEVYTNSGAMYDQTIYSAKSNKKLIPLKKNKPTEIYGGYSGNKDAYMAIIKEQSKKADQYRVVGIPVRAVAELKKAQEKGTENYQQAVHKVIAERLGAKKKFEVVLPKVMYRQLIVDGDKKFTLGGAKDRYNAVQLVLSNESMQILNTNFTKGTISIEKLNKKLVAVYDEVTEIVVNHFPLYDGAKLKDGRDKFKELLPYSKEKNELSKFEILRRILIGLHDNASRTDLKAIGSSGSFGRFQTSGSISSNAYLIYQSPTGLFERKVYLNSIKNK